MDFMQFLREAKDASWPDDEYEYKAEDVRADQVRAGDTLQDGTEVAKPKTGTKWTEIFDKDGNRICRVHNDVLVQVTRRHRTAASRAAEERHAAAIQIAKDMLADPSADLIEAQKRLGEWIAQGYQLDSQRLTDLMYGDAKRVFGLQLRQAIEYQWEDDPELDLVTAYGAWIDDLKDQFFGYNYRFGTRQHSDAVDNMISSIRLDVMQEIIRDANWRGYKS
jgi:hypothetical protein